MRERARREGNPPELPHGLQVDTLQSLSDQDKNDMHTPNSKWQILFTWAAVFVGCASTGMAQGSSEILNPKPELADPASSAVQVLKDFASIRFAIDNQLADREEGLGPPDTGGYHGPISDSDPLTFANNIRVIENWVLTTGSELTSPVARFVGALRRSPTEPDMTAFEIYGPSGGPQNGHINAKPTVLVISLWSTIPPPSGLSGSDYPGTSSYGLIGPGSGVGGGPVPKSQDVAALNDSGNPYSSFANFYGAYIVPPEGWNPHALVYQRTYQLLQAFREVILQSNATALDKPLYVTVAGASMGGYNALDLVLQRPDLYHSALADVPIVSYRRLINLDGIRGFMSSLTGQPQATASRLGRRFNSERELQWAFGFDQLGASMHAASLLERYASNVPAPQIDLRRPVVLTFSDEDNVTGAGLEWAPILAGNENFPATAAEAPLRPGDTSQEAGPVTFEYELRHRDGHRFGKYSSLIPAPNTSTASLALIKAICRALCFDLGDESEDASTNEEPVLASWIDEPYDHVLNRAPRSPLLEVPGPSDQDIVTKDENFKKTGFGATITGLEVVVNDTADPAVCYLYAGTADGVISSFRVTSPNPEPVFVSQTAELGAGIYAMARNADGTKLAAASYRGIKIFDISQGLFTGSVSTPAGYSQDRAHSYPRLLAFSDMFPNQGTELMYVTSSGGLFARSADLSQNLLTWREPGIDFFFTNPAARHVLIGSQRQHIALLELENNVPKLLAISPYLGLGADFVDFMAPLTWGSVNGGQPVIAGLSGGGDSFRFWNPTTLAEVSGNGVVMTQPEPGFEGSGSLVCNDSGLMCGFEVFRENPFEVLVLRNDMLYLCDDAGAVLCKKSLRTLAQASSATAFTVADVLPSPGNEVVLGTRSGAITILTRSDLESVDAGLDERIITGVNPGDQTNNTTSCSWALTAGTDGKLHGVSGSTMFSMNPSSGVVVTRKNIASVAGLAYSRPVWDMSEVGFGVGGQFNVRNWTSTFALPGDEFEMDLGDYQVVPGAGGSGAVLAALRHGVDQEGNPDGPLRRWVRSPVAVSYQEGFWIFDHGGDVAHGGTNDVAFFWSGEDEPSLLSEYRGAPNLVGRLDYTHSGANSSVAGTWGSGGTGPISAGNDPNDLVATGDSFDLRSDFLASDDYQSVRLFRPDPTNPDLVFAALNTTGAHIQILSASGVPTSLSYSGLAASGYDLGYGGLALAVGKLGTQTGIGDSVVYGSLTGPSDAMGSTYMHSKLGVVRYSAGSFSHDVPIDLDSIGVSEPSLGFGLCGLAIGNVTDQYPGNELVATTLNGEFMVFQVDTSGNIVVPPLHVSVHVGALGVGNSIVIADLDSEVPGNEIYVGSTQGVLRFTGQ